MLANTVNFSAYGLQFDNLGQVTSVDNGGTSNQPHVVLANQFDALGSRTSVAATVNDTPDFQNDYQLDNLRRTTRVEQHDQVDGNAVAEKRADIAYNALGQYTSIDRFADLAGTKLVVSSGYGYDNLHRLTGLDHAQGTTALAGYDYTFDTASRVHTTDSLVDGLSTYSYDSTSQLTGADHASPLADESHSWDANGNQSGGSITILPDNILQEDANFLYEHDAEGNLTKKTDKVTGDYTLYGWDYRNRLTSVEFYNDEDELLKRVEYDYDVFDRRIAKRVDENGDTVFERAEKYVYDGEDIVLVFDATDSLTDRFLHGPGIDEVFADERFIDDVFDDTYYPLADHLGSIRDVAVYDSILEETSIAKHLTLDSFGKILDDSAPSLRFLYAFTGREWDGDALLYYFRRRWMSPDMRQFIGKDPIGFLAGDTNTGRYVGNFVTGAVDPSGLSDSMQGVDSDLQIAFDRSNAETLNYVITNWAIPSAQARLQQAFWWFTRTTGVGMSLNFFNFKGKKEDIEALDDTLTALKDSRFGDPLPIFGNFAVSVGKATTPGQIIVNGIDIYDAAVADDPLSRAIAKAKSRRHGAEQVDQAAMTVAGEAVFGLSPGVCPPLRPRGGAGRGLTARQLQQIEELTAEFRAAVLAREAEEAARQAALKDPVLVISDEGLKVVDAPRITLHAADVTAGMEINPAEVNIFRGGSSLQARPIDFKVDPVTGMLKTTHGLSLDVSAEAMNGFGGAFRIESIPAELRIIQRGGKLGHFEIVPRTPISPQRFQELLDQIKLVPAT